MNENPTTKRKKLPFRSWYSDPEQVENLVTLLEAKRVKETGQDEWKYGSSSIHEILFPKGENEWEGSYNKARIPPGSDSFRDFINKLSSGRLSFGSNVPRELVERFHAVMEARAGVGVLGSSERKRFWTHDKRIITAGLQEYCGLRTVDINKLLSEKLGLNITNSQGQVSTWRRNKEFPFEDNQRLKQATPLASLFVEELEIMLGMNLHDVREWMKENLPNQESKQSESTFRLQMIDEFIDSYKKYSERKK